MIKNLIKKVESYIPMTLGNLMLFLFVIYLLFVVSKSIINNHNSNREIEVEKQKLYELESEISALKNEINYLNTYSFKEKEAREKLGYKAEGEKMVPLPIDTIEEKIADSGYAPAKIKSLNYRLWWEYFFK